MKNKTRNNGEWTEARWHSFIVSALRAATRRYPPKFLTLNESKTVKKVNPSTGRVAQHYKCAHCIGEFPLKQVQVDHILPIIGKEGFTTWDEYVKRMFCNKDNLQVLCLECHGEKTKKEREKTRL